MGQEDIQTHKKDAKKYYIQLSQGENTHLKCLVTKQLNSNQLGIYVRGGKIYMKLGGGG